MQTIDLQAVPFKVLISMEDQNERRESAQKQLATIGVNAEWRIPVKIEDIPWEVLPVAYKRSPKYASQAATLLKVLNQVKRSKASSFMLFEDDLILHQQFETLLPSIQVPSDWSFIYLGGRNNGKGRFVSPGLIRSTFISDLHAVILRSDIIDLLRNVLLDPKCRSHWADARIAMLHKSYSAYLCRPNLVWQSVHANEEGLVYSNYNEDGSAVQEMKMDTTSI
jgi:hypothetical protein